MNRTIRLALLGAALAAQTACAYHQAMREAEEAARNRNWDAAMASYEEAGALKPKKTEPNEGWEQARARGIAQALDEARTALEAGAYETVDERLDWVTAIDNDVPDVVDLRRQAEEQLTEAVASTWGAGDPAGSYALAIRLRTLHPDNKRLERIFTTLRDHYVEVAEAQLKEKAYEAALASVRTITDFEPEETARVEPTEQKILGAWADELVREARAEERARHQGAAAMLYARAHAIAGRDADRDAARRLAESLEEEGRFTVDLQVTGAPNRTEAVKKALENAVASIPEGRAASGGDLTLRVSLPAVRCTESATSTPRTQEYVSGQRQVDNPAYAEVTAALEKESAGWDAAHAEAQALWDEVEALKADVAELDGEIATVTSERDAAKRKEMEAKEQYDAADRLLSEKQSALQAALGSSADSIKEEIERVGATLIEWDGVLTKATEARTEVDGRLEALQAERDAVAPRLDEKRAAYEAVMERRNGHEKAKNELSAKQRATPRQVSEDVKATHEYVQKAWTRTCVAKGSATARPRWDTSLETSMSWAPERTTEDSSNPGHAPSGVKEDPKAYPTDDEALVADADTENADAAGRWLVSLADEHYRVLVQETLGGIEREDRAATSDAIALLLGARGRLEPAQVEAMLEHLRSYGVEDPEAALGAK